MTTRTQVIRVRKDARYGDAVQEAVRRVRDGGLIVFPTETVYGVGCNAAHDEAWERLCRLKQRVDGTPFTVHIGRPEHAEAYVPALSPLARRMMKKGWPGPLTLIFDVPDIAAARVVHESGGTLARLYHDGTIGLRCPDHHFAADFLTGAEVPIVAASANRAGRPAPQDADAALAQLEGDVDLVIDDGPARYRKASTIVRITERGYTLQRTGVLDERMVRKLAGLSILMVCSGNTCRSPMAEAIGRRLLAERLGVREETLADMGFSVRSAGVNAAHGMGASAGAIEACRRRGLDLSRHVSRGLDIGMIHEADHIWVMCRHHYDSVTAMVPSAKDRARLIGGEVEVDDPVGQPDDIYETCAARLAEFVSARLKEIEL